MKKGILAVVLAMMLLTSCATKEQVVKDPGFQPDLYKTEESMNKAKDLLLEPVDGIGIELTDAIRAGNYLPLEVIFPDILLEGELFPGKIKWFAWARDNDGIENLVQLTFVYGRIKNQATKEKRWVGVIVVDGNVDMSKNPKAIGLSGRMQYCYNLQWDRLEIPIELKKFTNDSGYRAELVNKYGVQLKDLKPADYLKGYMQEWTNYDSKRGEIRSPLTEKGFIFVAGINPAISHSQKALEYGQFAVGINPIGTGIGMFFDLVVNPMRAQEKGWSFKSMFQTQRQNALALRHLREVQEKLDIQLDE